MSKLEKTIRVTGLTYEKLSELGKFRDDFDSILQRLLKQNEKSGLGNPETKN